MLHGLREPFSGKSLQGIFLRDLAGKLAARPTITLGCFSNIIARSTQDFWVGRAVFVSYRQVLRSVHGLGHAGLCPDPAGLRALHCAKGP